MIAIDDDISDLIARIADRDRHAFAALHEKTSRRLRGVVQRLLVDSAQAEEVVQEVYLEIWLNAPAFSRDRATAVGWMYMIARRRAIDRIRASQASRNRDARAARAAVTLLDDDFGDALDTRIAHARAMDALDTLTPLQREAVVLVYCRQFSAAEAAAALRVAPGVVRSRARDGIHRLRTVLTAAS